MATVDDNKKPQMAQNISAMIERANAMLHDIDRIEALSETNKHDTNTIVKDLALNIKHIKQLVETQKVQRLERTENIKAMPANLELSLNDIGLTLNQKKTLLDFLNAAINKSIALAEAEIDTDSHIESLLQDISVLIELHR